MDVYVDTVFDYFTIVEIRFGIPKLSVARYQSIIEEFAEYLKYMIIMVEKNIKKENSEIIELYLEFLKIKKINVMAGDNTQAPIDYVTQLAKNLYNYQDAPSKYPQGQNQCDITSGDIQFFCDGNVEGGLNINREEV